jgi:acetylornithine deacetylase/succinyl-diaminopimelate desuccinylase-like protein
MTIAVINSMPQSINTISGHVQLNLDIRSPADSDVEAMETACRENFAKIAKDSGLEVTFECIWISPAVVFDEVMVGCVRESAKEVQCAMELTSGAGHDSVYTSKRCPTAMIFVRCKDGISHNPAEYTRPEE